ncbi:PiggyBac transposable element-derived protein 3 [Trichinella britovi]|uniref:PiggyBac transposable element-derived protein 3 n=1 Tax=Trichinella britovi TaxID=45882 RepID=A0A0V1D878_TRIBR|nr:PiggyBac transposable element-derived protein 3 [Trichinella britovi]
MYQRLNDRLLQCGIFHWLSALMNLWSHTMVGAAQRFHKGKADSHGLQGLDALCFFTSSDTLKKLSDLNVRATGTVRLNRSGTTSEMLTSNKELMKLRRNLYDCSCDGKVYIVRWHDKAVVTVASNCWQTYSRLHTMNQQVAFQRKYVKHTHLIQAYNSGMGDTYCCSTSY